MNSVQANKDNIVIEALQTSDSGALGLRDDRTLPRNGIGNVESTLKSDRLQPFYAPSTSTIKV